MFTCQDCGASFTLPQHVLDRYPGWTPPRCNDCRKGSSPAASNRRRSATTDSLFTTDEVLERFHEGPTSGVFTDGGSVPNPGPGGWGAVYVVEGEIVAQASGHDPDTTNNRMELTALIEGGRLVPEGMGAIVYTDSRLAVNTLTDWARGWEKRGWRRKSGPVENLDLVKTAYYLYRDRPELEIRWIAAHSGYRWNEYADALASRWRLGR